MPVKSRPTKPTFQGLVDLGLRDVGVKNSPRRMGAHFAKSTLKLWVLLAVSACATCAFLGASGAGRWIIIPLALVWTAALLLLTLRMVKRSPMVVAKVTDEGANQASRVLIALFLLSAVLGVAARDPVMIPMVVIGVTMAVVVWRARDRVPEMVRELRPLLAGDESVLGDGVGRVRKVRKWQEAVRLVVATDRRLLIATSPQSSQFLLADVPYSRVSRFAFDWKYDGSIGELSLTVDGEDGQAAETHVVTMVAPANLLSIARALRDQGVEADDPAALVQAEGAWEEAVARDKPAPRRRKEWKRLLDRADMYTPDFDHGLWLLLGLGALVFYVNPFGIGIGAERDPGLAVVAAGLMCGVCGHVSRTESSLTYLVPLNLLATPAFFFWEASYVIALMIVMSGLAAAGLWVGAWLRKEPAQPVDPLGGAPVTPPPPQRPTPGSLRHALSGVRLIRITGGMLMVMGALLMASVASGIELTSLRYGVEELTLEGRPVDGRSNLTGGAASIRYKPDGDLREFITDSHADPDSYAGSRWELRSKWTQGYNLVSLATYRPNPPVETPEGLAYFLARKDREHSLLAGWSVTHAELTVDGRKGYYWHHDSDRGYRYYAAWFPQAGSTVRLECIYKNERKKFERLCGEALRSLKFRSATP